jgi:hypothetical protein
MPRSRSKAPPWNPLSGRLCLHRAPVGVECNEITRQSLAGSEFPGRAWEQELREFAFISGHFLFWG